jgi:RimJ/RimL family protein N-acetyltransferase
MKEIALPWNRPDIITGQSSASNPVMEVPAIETKRLTMRGHRLNDFSDCAAMWADPIVTRHIGGKPFSREEVWARLLRYVGHWSLMGFGYWAIEEKDTGSFVGELGFADYKRDIEPSLNGVPELGWVLASRVHGKGYATEAVRAAVAWGEARFGSARTVCLIHPENLASIRVAQKCGYQESQQAAYKGQPTIIFARQGSSLYGVATRG